MDKERKMLYTILGALAALAAAAAVVLAFKKRKCDEKKLIDEIDNMVALGVQAEDDEEPCDDNCKTDGEEAEECAEKTEEHDFEEA